MSESELVIHGARAEDKRDVLRFVSRTWRWGDYIPEVWDEWLNDPNGRMFVAVLNGRVVGMNHVRFLTPRYVWMEGARVDREFRRRGIATALAIHAMKFSSQKGAKVARLAATADNEAAKAHLKKIGFRIDAKFVRLRGRLLTKDSRGTVRAALLNELDSLWSEIRSSATFKASGGLFARNWVWYELTRQTLEEYVNRNRLLVALKGRKRTGVALFDSTKVEDKVLEIDYVDGDSTSLRALLSGVKEVLEKRFSTRAGMFAPKHPPLVSRLMELGLKKGDEYLVFSKNLPLTT